ncbi:MAG: hypothetical protein M3R67_09015, partial [Acidobacteriota bacterium]|nr:hypothetical protein [Acidobacteriota bacterium]
MKKSERTHSGGSRRYKEKLFIEVDRSGKPLLRAYSDVAMLSDKGHTPRFIVQQRRFVCKLLMR